MKKIICQKCGRIYKNPKNKKDKDYHFYWCDNCHLESEKRKDKLFKK